MTSESLARPHAESALIVAVPEVEALVAPFRMQHDPAAAKGVPAHVTVLYPFVTPSRISPAIVRTLTELIAALPRFRASFAELRRFPGVLYLAPEPAASFRRLTERVVDRFPETPPYEGRFDEVIPHLTVAHAGEPSRLEEIAAKLSIAATRRLPIRADVREIVLIERRGGPWRARQTFPLSDTIEHV